MNYSKKVIVIVIVIVIFHIFAIGINIFIRKKYENTDYQWS